MESLRAGSDHSPYPSLRPSRLPLRARLARRLAAADSRLSPGREVLLAAGLVVGIAAGALVLVLTVRVVRAARAGARAPIAWEGDVRETAFPPTAYRAAEPPAEARPDPPAATTSPARIDWTSPARLRRAASLLVLLGDLRGAIDLLPADDPDRRDLAGVPSAMNDDVLAALDRILPAEGERARAALDRPAPVAGEAAASGPGPVTGPSAIGGPGRFALLRRAAAGLPDDALYRLAVNLHASIRTRTGAGDAHLRLLLESIFPPGSPARAPYVENRAPRPLPYRAAGDPQGGTP